MKTTERTVEVLGREHIVKCWPEYFDAIKAGIKPFDVRRRVTPKCEHEFAGWREFEDGNGGEQVCTKCGMGAMAASLRDGP